MASKHPTAKVKVKCQQRLSECTVNLDSTPLQSPSHLLIIHHGLRAHYIIFMQENEAFSHSSKMDLLKIHCRYTYRVWSGEYKALKRQAPTLFGKISIAKINIKDCKSKVQFHLIKVFLYVHVSNWNHYKWNSSNTFWALTIMQPAFPWAAIFPI